MLNFYVSPTEGFESPFYRQPYVQKVSTLHL